MSHQDFETFISQVEKILEKKTGLTSKYLPEWDWFQYYTDLQVDGESADAELAVECFLEEYPLTTLMQEPDLEQVMEEE